MVAKITRDVLESHLACEYKCHLKLVGRQGSPSNYESWLVESKVRAKRDAIVNLLAHHRESEIVLLSLRFDGLIKAEGSSNLGQFHYVPILFHEGQVRTRQRVLLELFGLVLLELQGRAPGTALIWRSAGKPTTIRLAPDLKTARSIMAKIEQVQRDVSVPMLLLNDHCHACEFQDSCYAQAQKEDNLSLLRGMNKLQIARLNNKGIFTVNQLSYTFKPRRRPKRAKRSAIVHHFPLQALAIRDKKVFVHGNPVLSCSDTRIYLDIEGTPENRSYYLIGVITVANGQSFCDAYWADSDSMQDQVRIFEKLLEHLRHYKQYNLFHFGSYEMAAFRRMKSHMTESSQCEMDAAMKRSVNVLSVISPFIYFPTYSNGLKHLGRFLGYQWSDPASSGVQSLVWRARWLESHDNHLKAKLIQYNYEDRIALKGVVEFIEKAMLANTVAPLRANNSDPVVYTDTLTAGKDEWHLYGSTEFALDDFRVINQFSYFNYQRDRVFARSKNCRIKQVVRKTGRSHTPNKIVEIRTALVRLGSYGTERRQNTVEDLLAGVYTSF